MSYETILYETEGQLGTITLNRPEKFNAIRPPMPDESEAAVIRANRDPAVKVIILKGAGKSFCAGFDFSEDLDHFKDALEPDGEWDPGKDMVHATYPPFAPVPKFMGLWRSPKPVIAQVHGYAMAGGLELVGACDLVYAANDARFSHPVTRFAGLPDFPWFAAKLETRHAMELHLTGREYVGEEAIRIGIVNQIFAPEDLDTSVLDIATNMATSESAVLSVQKRYVYTALEGRGGHALIRTGNDLSAGPHMQALTNADPKAILERVKSGRR